MICEMCGGTGQVYGGLDCAACDGPKCDGTQYALHQKGDGSWWETDVQGIPLCRVCENCEEEKLSRYRPEILTGYDQSDVDEPIEPSL